MKRHLFLSITALLLFCYARGQQVTAAEYFFDMDPGVGNGTALSVIAGDTVNFSGSISASSLSSGFHYLYIRSKDSNGAWSLDERRMFYITSPVFTPPSLSASEYFFDTDPGLGNGTALTVTPGDSILFSGSVVATGLPNGFHFFYIRSKDANGTWSLTERRMFYIQSGGASSPALSAAEYFLDTDPGVGNGTPLIVVAGDSILFSGNIPSGVLSNGFHFLYIRAKGLDNKWGLAERRMFYIQAPVTAVPILVAAEYFVNADPGFGSATPITVIPGDSIDFSGPLTVTNTLVGSDSLYIRVRDLLGVWSLYEPRGFRISPVSVDEIPGNDEASLFQNYPNPFTHSTFIDYYITHAVDVTISITDLAGRTVLEINKGNLSPGKYSVEFSNSTLQEGCYFYKIVAGDFTATRRMVYLKE